MEIIPTILTNSHLDLEKKLEFLKDRVEWIQIDVIDGKFVSHRTFEIEQLNNFQDKNFFWDIHLMVKNPFSWVSKCSFVMAQRVVGQIEFMGNQLDFIDRVESEGMEAGLAIDLDTPVDSLNHEAVFRSSVVLVLAVKAGESGQRFSQKSLKKIKELVELKDRLRANFKIGVDGGVDKNNLATLAKRKVDIAYIGSAIWNASNWTTSLNELLSFQESS
jgi:ribulose-phosphate 3-epimerase